MSPLPALSTAEVGSSVSRISQSLGRVLEHGTLYGDKDFIRPAFNTDTLVSEKSLPGELSRLQCCLNRQVSISVQEQ